MKQPAAESQVTLIPGIMYENQVEVRKRPTTAVLKKLLPPQKLATRESVPSVEVEVGNPIHMASQFI